MEIELRPLTTGEVLDRTFQFFRARFGMFVGIATVAALIRAAGSALQIFGTHAMQRNAAAHGLAAVVGGVGILVSLFVALLAYALSFAAITRAVMALNLGQPTGIASSYEQVWPRWFRYIRLNLTAGFLMAWPFLLVMVLFVVEILLTLHGRHSMTGPKAGLIVLFSVVEFLIAAPVCIWLLCRYGLCMAACVVEDLKVWSSIRRSVRLSKGLRLKIFVLILLVYIMEIILGSAVMIPVLGIIIHAHGHIPIGVVVYELAMGFVLTSLITPIYGIGLTVIYMDARIRKEGYDIELMMQRTGGQPSEVEPNILPGDSAPSTMG